ncbi:MAG: choice-of-anchor D domain-containing protein [Myxococcaceae bacterium]|nr:choice-of-anchor D domain-containing protein [Myxococcaceae bacterium]
MSARVWLSLAAVVVLGVGCNRQGTQAVKPQLVVPEMTYDFGAVPVLNTKALDVPLRNIGRKDLVVSKVTLSSPDGAFTTTVTDATVQAAETVPVAIVFKPREEKAYQATLTVESDDEENPTVTVTLTGTGSTRARVEVAPDMLDFGRVPECSSAVKSFVIRSTGTADLILTGIRFEDGTSPSFGFVGSTKTPATVKHDGGNGQPGQIQLTVKVTVAAGTMGMLGGAILLETTDPDRQTVRIPLFATVNRAPVATIAPTGNGAPGLTVALDGSGSMDPDGDSPLGFKWTLRSKPLASMTTIAMPDQATTSMTLDPQVPGAYEVQLDVVDGAGVKSCQPARATVVAAPAQKLLIELFWDNAQTDLDLHVLRKVDGKVGSADDCYYADPKPDWGIAADKSDDPELVRDALTGYGPELFGWVNPVDGTSRVVIDFANEHLSPTPASKATVRVYYYGVVKAEATRTLDKAGDRWAVCDVEWPSGKVTVLP